MIVPIRDAQNPSDTDSDTNSCPRLPISDYDDSNRLYYFESKQPYHIGRVQMFCLDTNS